jgi:D-alanyl-D-alanine carboxypeptidase/D-alanyl-D-alanine-endopeptidase (penicillin-binding protein 4)
MRCWAVVGSLLLVGFTGRSGLGQSLERAVAAAEALGARTGVVVCGADAKVLYRHRPTELFAPASNMKVLTAAAVIAGLGPEYAFRTRFQLEGGNLVVLASGDPNWISGQAHDPAAVFGTVAANLRKLGVRCVGTITRRPGTFPGPGRPATWPQDQLSTYYCAPTGPFVLEQGTFHVHIEARQGDAHAEVVAPRADLPLRSQLSLVDAQKNATYGAIDQGDAVLVRGRFPRRGSPVTIKTAVDDPAVWYLAALRQALVDGGVTLGSVPSAADKLVYEHGSGLEPAIQRMLEDSSNFDAEQCLRVLGHKLVGDGSLAGARAALQQQVTQLVGRMPDGIVFADGSGLSRQNQVSPGLLVATLVGANRGPGSALLRNSLPVAGRSGTLSERFIGSDLVGRVHAKTGWIRGASSLSGYVETTRGQVRWFSILMNYDPKKDGLNRDLKQLQEDIVRAIDRLDG